MNNQRIAALEKKVEEQGKRIAELQAQVDEGIRQDNLQNLVFIVIIILELFMYFEPGTN